VKGIKTKYGFHASARDELVNLASWLVFEEALKAKLVTSSAAITTRIVRSLTIGMVTGPVS
jgi:hypothetical protein